MSPVIQTSLSVPSENRTSPGLTAAPRCTLFSTTVPLIGARIQTVGSGALIAWMSASVIPRNCSLRLAACDSAPAKSDEPPTPGAVINFEDSRAWRYSDSAVMKSGL